MFKSALFALVVALGALVVTSPAPAVAASAARADGLRLRTNLVGNTAASGHADYREFTKNGQPVRSFSVEVEDAKPGSIWAIRHNGKVIGHIRINNLGNGDFDRQTITDDPGEQGFVPVMKAGDKITVGPGVLSGTLKRV
jgi:hypothetical protein